MNHDCTLAKKLPPELREWLDAIISEAAAVPRGRARIFWVCGGLAALISELFRIGIRRITRDHDGNQLPLELLIVAAYQCLFSAVLIGVIAFQIPQIRESWIDAIPVLAICLFLVCLPAVFGVGLFLLDDASRIASIIFSIAHGLMACHMIQLKWPDHAVLPILRLLFDAFVIFALLRKSVRSRFNMPRQELHLIR
jgi:hypothetical protein